MQKKRKHSHPPEHEVVDLYFKASCASSRRHCSRYGRGHGFVTPASRPAVHDRQSASCSSSSSGDTTGPPLTACIGLQQGWESINHHRYYSNEVGLVVDRRVWLARPPLGVGRRASGATGGGGGGAATVAAAEATARTRRHRRLTLRFDSSSAIHHHEGTTTIASHRIALVASPQ